MAEVKIETTERQIGHFREQLSRIIRNAKLIKEGRTHVKDTNKSRLEIIEECARQLDEECKAMQYYLQQLSKVMYVRRMDFAQSYE